MQCSCGVGSRLVCWSNMQHCSLVFASCSHDSMRLLQLAHKGLWLQFDPFNVIIQSAVCGAVLQEPSEVIDPLVTLKLLDASAASASARQVVRAGPALHDGLAAEGSLKDARLRALAAAQDSSKVSCAGDTRAVWVLSTVWCRTVAKSLPGWCYLDGQTA